MEAKYIGLNNLLEAFAEAEKTREENILRVSKCPEKSILLRYQIDKKDITNIQKMYDRMGNKPIPESLIAHNLSSAEVFVYNDVLKGLAEHMIVEMIRQGLIILEIEDTPFNDKIYNLTLSTLVTNPKENVKRINITRTSE